MISGPFYLLYTGGLLQELFWIHRSESPTQAFLITILWLYQKFKALEDTGESEESIIQQMTSTILAYDNMCHMDSLVISKSNLPLPKPYDQVWKYIGKVIDRLHLRNHVDEKCKRLYNADDKIPKQFNTLACEQTFIWASRFKKVMCAMPHIHQFFFLHRIVKHRNRYNEKCHQHRKLPILPKKGNIN